MTDKFVINGGKELNGEIEVRGSKNAAGPALIACLLTKEECIIDNVPFIDDILSILDILKSMGCEVEKIGEEKVRIKAENVNLENIDLEKELTDLINQFKLPRKRRPRRKNLKFNPRSKNPRS